MATEPVRRTRGAGCAWLSLGRRLAEMMLPLGYGALTAAQPNSAPPSEE